MTHRRTVLAATGALWSILLGLSACGTFESEPAAEEEASGTLAAAPETPGDQPASEDPAAAEPELQPSGAWDTEESEAAPAEMAQATAGSGGGGAEGRMEREVVDSWGEEAAPRRRVRRQRRPGPSSAAPRPAPIVIGNSTGRGQGTLGGYGPGAGRRGTIGHGAPPAAAPAAPLPQNGVLASTFVGGSGAQARLEDLLDRGVMVGGENVRLEAFDELGRLPYAVPGTEAVGLHAELERSQLLTGGERVHLQIALMAHQGEAPPRPRMDVRLVMDRSGSMTGEKWNHAMAAARQLLERLRPNDTFGLISYSDDASVDFRPARVGNGRAARRAIDALEPGGGTNIEAALRAVSANAPRRRAMNDVLLVVLVSDGVANVGQT
ncbi:MAG: vWA domain-containing protein, partial [Planctomycetota bacterium]